jgi:phosphoglycolate phosphatase-like HAD superfamily hydrolase
MRVCLFDIDGTLIQSGGAGRAAMETALRDEFGIERVSYDVAYSGRTDRAIGRDLLRHHTLDDHDANWTRLRDAYLRALPASLRRHRGKILPGVIGLLQILDARADVVMGLLTGNVQSGAHAKLLHFGLHKHFVLGGYGDHHVDRDDVAREAHAEVVRHLNGRATPDRVWVIGDTPLDIQCARAIGAGVVAVATGWHPIEELRSQSPNLVLADLSDPDPVLELMFDDNVLTQ